MLSIDGIVAGDPECLPADPLAVMTAYNPGVNRPGSLRNEAANQRLEEILRARRYRFWPAAGYSPDRSHTEPSYAVEGLSEEDARELGRQFGQAAVFYWKGGMGSLLWCRQAEA